ncbi:MAG: hypothetical protein M3066_07195, partial [Actinomycetota bacterium]|nr:hypothetical protein [Actinomycetota bacterium]
RRLVDYLGRSEGAGSSARAAVVTIAYDLVAGDRFYTTRRDVILPVEYSLYPATQRHCVAPRY